MIYLILNAIEVTSKEQLEEPIVELPKESKIALRSLFETTANQLDDQ